MIVSTLDSNYNEVSKTQSTLALPGTNTSDSLPFLVAEVVSLRSNLIGARTRGRTFLPAMAEDQINNDLVIPAAVTRISAAVRAVQSAIQADGSTIFVAKRGQPSAPIPIPPGPKFVITTLLTSNKPARQARRTRKVRATYL